MAFDDFNAENENGKGEGFKGNYMNEEHTLDVRKREYGKKGSHTI